MMYYNVLYKKGKYNIANNFIFPNIILESAKKVFMK